VSQIFSDFSLDADGWTVTAGQGTLAYHADGGNLGGYITGTDSASGDLYFKAGAKFLGDLTQFSRGLLTFDFKAAALESHNLADVRITGVNGGVIVINMADATTDWQTFGFRLDTSANWRLNNISGARADAAQIYGILTNVAGLEILSDQVTGTDTSSLDNVSIVSTAINVNAHVIASDFSIDNDGWMVVGDVGSSNYDAVNGNPAGSFHYVDAVLGDDVYYLAPLKFLGNKSDFYHGTLSYDVFTTGNVNYDGPDVAMTGADGTILILDFPTIAKNVWTHHVATLDTSANWRVGTASGAVASDSQIQTVLSNLVELKIIGEFVNGPESGNIDNVILDAPAALSVSWERFTSVPHQNIEGVFDTIAAALASASAGDELVLNNPFDLVENFQSQAINIDNLTVEGGTRLNGVFTLGVGVSAFKLVGATDADVTGNNNGDTIFGSNGSNALTGGTGNDRLDGGLGADILSGGAGLDRFLFDATALSDAQAATPIVDVIKDYDQGNAGIPSVAEGDQIDLSAIVGTAFTGGQAATALVRLVDHPTNSHALLQVDPDGLGNGIAWTTIASLDGIHGSDSANVILSGSQPAGTSFFVLSNDGHFGDFDGDHMADIVWRNDNGSVAIWQMNGGGVTAGNFLPTVTSDWHILGTGDFNADGKTDILWQNDNGTLLDWQMASSSALDTSFGIGTAPANSVLAGIGDVDHDGKSDLIWRDQSSGAVTIAPLGGTSNTIALGNDWQVVGVGDYNGDGKADLMFRNAAQGVNAAWLMNGTSLSSTVFYSGVPNDWHVVGTGDFNGDGTADLLWHNDNGANAVWLMDLAGHVAQAGFFSGVSSDWHVVGTGDFNGDHADDVIWRNDTGATAIWQMHGALNPTVAFPGGVPNDWATQAHHYDFV
jgi:hypothetical protein